MSRKKIKKELVRRNISMYDPMGVYGRGLTKNQKEGMTRRMKIEYMSPPPVRINQQLLEDYKKTLINYGIPTLARRKEINLVTDITPTGENTISITFNAADVIEHLRNQGINPLSFRIYSFHLQRLLDTWPLNISYQFFYGNGSRVVTMTEAGTSESSNSATCLVPCYYKHKGRLYYYSLTLDSQHNDLYATMTSGSIGGSWTDLKNLDLEGYPLPFIKYPVGTDNVDPYMIFSCDRPAGSGESPVIRLTMNLQVIY